MKKFTFLLLVLYVLASSCAKESGLDCPPAEAISLDGSVKITEGVFVYSSSKNAGGVAKIYKQPDGKYVLALEQMNLSGNIELQIYFSGTSVLTRSSFKLFSGKVFNGTIYYEIPAGINIADFGFVVIQSDLVEQAVASAELR